MKPEQSNNTPTVNNPALCTKDWHRELGYENRLKHRLFVLKLVNRYVASKRLEKHDVLSICRRVEEKLFLSAPSLAAYVNQSDMEARARTAARELIMEMSGAGKKPFVPMSAINPMLATSQATAPVQANLQHSPHSAFHRPTASSSSQYISPSTAALQTPTQKWEPGNGHYLSSTPSSAAPLDISTSIPSKSLRPQLAAAPSHLASSIPTPVVAPQSISSTASQPVPIKTEQLSNGTHPPTAYSQPGPLVASQMQPSVRAAAPLQATSAAQQQAIPSAAAARPTHSANPSSQPVDKARAHMQRQYIRQQQQRLLLLRHAVKCKDDPCNVTPYCKVMQRLWAHLSKCKNPDCDVSHCASSRFVLTHYQRCKKPDCAVCVPVRNAVRKHGISTGRSHKLIGSEGTLRRTYELMRQPLLKKHIDPSDPEAARKRENYIDLPVVLRDGLTIPKPERGDDIASSWCLAMNYDQLLCHIKSLRYTFDAVHSSADIVRICLPIVKELCQEEYAWIFDKPVDTKSLNIPDYFDIVKKPMDLGTISKRLESNQGFYKTFKQFADDVRMVWYNARLYNPVESDVHTLAIKYERKFEHIWATRVEPMIQKTLVDNLMNRDHCLLCGGNRLEFAPATVYCNICREKIRRNAHFYKTTDNKTHICNVCFPTLKSNHVTTSGEIIRRSELTKTKNDTVAEETWVACDYCERWVHQVCALFNGKRDGNAINTRKYICPECTLRYMVHFKTKEPLVARFRAARDLPKCHLAEFIEHRLNELLFNHRVKLSHETGASLDKIATIPSLTLRMVACKSLELKVAPRMAAYYRNQGYPTVFPYQSKALMLWQNLDGVDTLIFGMYVQEFGSDCPPPNRNTAYLSYLDSVKFFRPAELRTIVFQEIIIAYLEYIKLCGFHELCLWACPPLKGDDYILHCHPEEQKTPKQERLRSWYVQLIQRAMHRRIVDKFKYLADEYFPMPPQPKGQNAATTATGPVQKWRKLTELGYYEGDYWPGMAEDYLKEMEEESKNESAATTAADVKKKKGTDKKTKKPKKTKPIAPRGAVDEEDVLRDKIAELMIKSFPKDFIIAKLQPSCNHCHQFLVEGSHMTCLTCKNTCTSNNFDLCKRCFSLRQLGDPQPSLYCPCSPEACVMKSVRLFPVIPTVIKKNDPEVHSEFFNRRQNFLDLCKGNHYQFDQLRRAKHSSMMILYHLHNPGAPSFVHSCNKCQQDIITGMRYQCPICSDYDLCDQCYKETEHEHELEPKAVTGVSEAVDAASQERAELEWIDHAAHCAQTQCDANCAMFKDRLRHLATCVANPKKCERCKATTLLVQRHAKQCLRDTCQVPNCMHLRRQMQQREQAHNRDRRKAALARVQQQQRAASAASNVPAAASSDRAAHPGKSMIACQSKEAHHAAVISAQPVHTHHPPPDRTGDEQPIKRRKLMDSAALSSHTGTAAVPIAPPPAAAAAAVASAPAPIAAVGARGQGNASAVYPPQTVPPHLLPTLQKLGNDHPVPAAAASADQSKDAAKAAVIQRAQAHKAHWLNVRTHHLMAHANMTEQEARQRAQEDYEKQKEQHRAELAHIKAQLEAKFREMGKPVDPISLNAAAVSELRRRKIHEKARVESAAGRNLQMPRQWVQPSAGAPPSHFPPQGRGPVPPASMHPPQSMQNPEYVTQGLPK